jgi:hypothetical protein
MKVISHTGKFVFFMIHSQSEQKVVATSMASAQGLFMQLKHVENIVEEYKDIFSSPTRVPMHYHVKHLIHITLSAPIPNGSVYHRSLMKNEEIKR